MLRSPPSAATSMDSEAKMDLLANIPSWGDIERNLEQKFSELNQSVDSGLNSAHEAWDGFSRRVSNGANQAYGYLGGQRIDNVRQAMALSYPIIQDNLKRKWSSIGIEQILPVLLQLVKEVSMILGGSVAVGTLAGGVAGAFAFGVGAAPGAVAGAGIGLQVGNLILMGLGLSAIAEYFYQGLPVDLAARDGHGLVRRGWPQACWPGPERRFRGAGPGACRACGAPTGSWAGAVGAAVVDCNRYLSDSRADEGWRDEQHGKHCRPERSAAGRDLQQAAGGLVGEE